MHIDATGSSGHRARLAVSPSSCFGCRSCEIACSMGRLGMVAPDASRVRVLKDEIKGVDRPAVCAQCNPCEAAAVCATGAFARDARTGALVVDRALCTGCMRCAEACTLGAVFSEEPPEGSAKAPALAPSSSSLTPPSPACTLAARVPLVCDLCGGGECACASACPSGALTVRA